MYVLYACTCICTETRNEPFNGFTAGTRFYERREVNSHLSRPDLEDPVLPFLIHRARASSVKRNGHRHADGKFTVRSSLSRARARLRLNEDGALRFIVYPYFCSEAYTLLLKLNFI